MSMFTEDLEVIIGAAKSGDLSLKFPFLISETTMNMGIAILDLSPRAFNGLKRNSIDTIGAITERFGTLNTIRNIGVVSIREVRNKTVAFLYESMSVNDKKAFRREFLTLNNIEGISTK